MTTYLLDTTVLVAHLRGHSDAIRFVKELGDGPDTPAICCVNVMEIEAGLRERDRTAAEALIERLVYLPTSRAGAERAGFYQAGLRGRGRTVGDADALIAGTAWANDAVLITENLKDFPMPDLRVERLPVR